MIDTGNRKYTFVIVGSGWRALHYVRIAKALPHIFELGAMLCRSKNKAEKLHRQYDIHTTTSIDECIDLKPDFVVVAVSRASIVTVSSGWMQRGFPVLCETPVAERREDAWGLRRLLQRGGRLTVAEQYTRYPINSALIKLIRSGVIGEAVYAYVSLAHDYHGASLIRGFLGLRCDIGYTIQGREFEFPTTETMNRYEKFTDGRTCMKKRALKLFSFENGKVALYDFDSEQYHSSIRANMLKIQGQRGEIQGETVRYLDKANEPHLDSLTIESRMVHRASEIQFMREVREIERITFCGEVLYEAPFGLCGLSEDETAMATLMWETGEYVKGRGENPYPFDEAVTDVEMGLKMKW